MSSLELVLRGVLVVIAYVGAVMLPYWVPLMCLVLLSLRFRAWEAIGVGLLMDFLWVPASASVPLPVFTVITIIILWMFEPLRSEFLLA